MHYLNEHNIFIFLIQIVILLGLARGLGELFRRWKQPSLTAELLVGILLGPTIMGRFMPFWHQAIFPHDRIQQNMLETVAWIGVLFLLLETGLEIDFISAWRQRGDAAGVKVAFEKVSTGFQVTFYRSEAETTPQKGGKTVEKTVEMTVEKTVEKILDLLKANPQITQKEIINNTGLTRRGVEWNLKKLKDEKKIRRIGPDKGGHWEVLKG